MYMRGTMKRTKQNKRVDVKAVNGSMSKNVRFIMTETLWTDLEKVAEAEGREQGRPKSVASVMRKMLQAGVEARAK